MRGLGLVIAKDLRLLWRDRAALLFVFVAPIAVISVAGFSLASLYGADPTGETAYVFPLADEEGGELGDRLAERIAEESALELRRVPTREDAARLVRDKRAGTALVIPRGTEAALREGQPASLLLYVDPVKYLERLNVRLRLLGLRDQVTTEAARDQVARLGLPDVARRPGTLGIEEITLDGGQTHINTFDQNVPGFSVTFLLLGMLLGVSLGLLDERDWGTFDRLRAMPIGLGTLLGGKLASRFLVGCVQMILLLAVGRVAFGVSLGSAPWLLLLPVAGIVFAGTAFGLVVAALSPGRDTVLPVGSIVIVTMAAVGGCWWPIDLEPRWMRTVALAFPTTWAMEAFNDLMIRRRGLGAALRPTVVLLAYGALYLGIGLALFRARLRRAGA